MQNSTLSKRYAKAIFDLAIEQKVSDTVSDDFAEMQKILEDATELRKLIQNPVISKKDQHSAISFILKRINASNIMQHFISVLIYNGRLGLLPAAIKAYFEMDKIYKGQVTAQVISAQTLAAQQIKDIEKSLGSQLKKTVKVEPKVDEAIIGGVIVKIGSKMLDASISGKLDKLKILSKQAIAS